MFPAEIPLRIVHIFIKAFLSKTSKTPPRIPLENLPWISSQILRKFSISLEIKIKSRDFSKRLRRFLQNLFLNSLKIILKIFLQKFLQRVKYYKKILQKLLQKSLLKWLGIPSVFLPIRISSKIFPRISFEGFSKIPLETFSKIPLEITLKNLLRIPFRK